MKSDQQFPQQFQHVGLERHGPVALVTLRRGEALNALDDALLSDLARALDTTEEDAQTAAVVLTGSARAFAAGADVKEMLDRSFTDWYVDAPMPGDRERAARVRKPLIAAVAGHALGGGAELAMMCDIVVAATTAVFGQPEITLGTLPGAGGTQRLARAVGKAMAMDLVLTGRTIDADEALRIGLVSRVVEPDELVEQALRIAAQIASRSRPAVLMAKESVNAAFETTLAEGLRLERRLFQASFATPGRHEAMAAFVAAREARHSPRTTTGH